MDHAIATADARTRALLVAVLVLYSLILAGLMAMDRATFVWKTAAVPAVVGVALLSGRPSAVARDWAPFLGAIILFDSFRGLIFAAIVRWELPYYARYAIEAEHALLGGTTLPHLLQGWWLVPGRLGLLDRVLIAVHASHFFFFLLFGVVVWRFRRAAFPRFQAAVLALLGAGLLMYALVPTVPPWMAAAPPLRLLPALTHVSAFVYGHDVLRPLTTTFDVNPIAAMPSLHAAFPALCTLFAMRVFGGRGLALAVYALMVCVAIGYLGEHYLVDVLAGLLLAVAVDLAVHARPVVRWLASGASVRAPVGWERLRVPVLAALLAVLAAEAIGQGAVMLRDGGGFHMPDVVARRLP
jgi:hypothetical protein